MTAPRPPGSRPPGSRPLGSRPSASVLLLAALAACAPSAPREEPRPASSGFCRVGPDGGPPADLAEGDQAGSDRGIGGTGIIARSEGTRADGDRGIGGTGIVGVVTGFASICVAGLRVAYDPAIPVAFADGTAPAAALRVGQVVVVEAGGPEGALRARRVAVRHEVSGRVEAVEDGAIRVAGERVAITGALPANRAWRVGEEVVVSGLRAPDGTLTATRVDPRPLGGATTIYGRLSSLGGLSLGGRPLRLSPGAALPPDGPVVARGRVENGTLVADTIEPDRLFRDPLLYFGTPRVLLESQVGLAGGALLLGAGPRVGLPSGGGIGPGRQVLELRAGPGGLSVAGPRGGSVRGGPGPLGVAPTGVGPGRAGAAPVPDRRFERERGMEPNAANRFGSPGGDAGRGAPGAGGPSGNQPGGSSAGPLGTNGGPAGAGPAGRR